MDADGEQTTELEVLESIFGGDECFSKVSENTFQYRFGEDGHFKSFVIEIVWPKEYPAVVPEINLDIFYNKHLQANVKETIRSALQAEAESYVGMAATFSLIEYAKEHYDELVKDQKEKEELTDDGNCGTNIKICADDDESNVIDGMRKLKMTKAQKRRMWDRTDASKAGERERGWNWVDILKHLSQTRDS
ncbi:hypothetical protein AB6A40_008227 [Gnathostoma spinigerum]|uniref:RWD domain-containing protein n=1 Tax=Gnathostoma spinigerum TaxID=75299 RepID=A0ABD6ENH2_9BILA